MRRNLIVVRAGDESLHPHWLEGCRERSFDLFVSYYGARPGRHAEHADYEAKPGMKWPRLYDLWRQRRAWLGNYDAVWFPDDDLMSDGANICAMFELFHAHALWLAQPALGHGSYLSHRITAREENSQLRFTSFVEVMCPIFAREALLRLGQTFKESVSGWGLDYLWPHVLGYPPRRMAILDATPVVHTRARAATATYATYDRIGVRPRHECDRILRKYRIQRCAPLTFARIAAASAPSRPAALGT